MSFRISKKITLFLRLNGKEEKKVKNFLFVAKQIIGIFKKKRRNTR